MKISYNAPVGYLGYGQVGGYLLNELVSQGHEVFWFPLGQPQVQEEHREAANQAYHRAMHLDLDVNTPSLKVWHENLLFEHVSRGLRAALPFFERDRFDRTRVVSLNTCDLVISPSKWGTQVLKDANLRPKVATIPMGVDRAIFHEHYTINRDDEVTRFVNVNKIEVRKGHPELIEAFNKAFEKTDKVELYLLWDNPFLSPQETSQWLNEIRTCKLADKITVVPRLQHNVEVAKLIASCDCSVCPTKAEGWGMSLLETLSCGRHLITTSYGAQTEFANTTNSRIIDIDNMVPAYDGKWFFGDFMWADIGEKQMDQLIEHMRAIHGLDVNEKRFNRAGVETAEEFSWSKTARLIAEALGEGVDDCYSAIGKERDSL